MFLLLDKTKFEMKKRTGFKANQS